ncbi:MAG: magnesium transporter MgtE N-terminal domain-containing protein, partial [Gammaproteobacteria bacterium]
MDSLNKLSPAQFLQHQLQEVITLLEKQQLEKSLLERSPGAHHELLETVLRKQQESRLHDKLAALHPADIAFILESLPLDQRKIAWHAIEASLHGQVLVEMSDAVRQTLISGMESEDLATVAENLDADEIADLAEDLPRNAMLKILRSLNSEERQHVNAVLAYEDDQVGAFMDFGMIAIREDLTLKAIADYIRKLGKLPGHTDKLFVVNQQDVVG